jgi:hypothetical protein
LTDKTVPMPSLFSLAHHFTFPNFCSFNANVACLRDVLSATILSAHPS